MSDATRTGAADQQAEFTVGTTALYRFFDADGDLLYVGIAMNPRSRFNGHASDKEWWPQVARKTVQWYPSRVLADAAETEAIALEKPRYNRAKVPGWLNARNAIVPAQPGATPEADQLRVAITDAFEAIKKIPDEWTAFGEWTLVTEILRASMVASGDCRAQCAHRIRESRGLSVAALAKLIGVSKATGSRLY